MRTTKLISKDTVPQVVGNYNITNYIASGGSSEIYIAKSLKFNEIYVAKVITVDVRNMEQQWKSFTAEVTALSQLNLPNIIRMYEHMRIGNQFILILEYCSNGSLSDRIKAGVGMPIPQFIEIAHQIVRALDFCHSKFIAHRDVKASNVLFDKYGRVKLSDFGLSIHAPYKMLQNAYCGSLVYTAPEIIQRKPNNPFYTDIWSLGVLFAVMLTGDSPWTEKSEEKMKKQITMADYRLPNNLPQAAVDLISQMIVIIPERRIKISELMKNEFLNSMPHHGKILNASSLYVKHSNPLKLLSVESNGEMKTHVGSSVRIHGPIVGSTIALSHTRSRVVPSKARKSTFALNPHSFINDYFPDM
ncbi:CAMK family protein kinase [Tritrichomonas foetus]|uniref:CAMK family protein kinase n=1 Tax=Tritrichomonas foetus TaxID=1144522 RepID=A0A1J4J5R7_9EUKA|nr:CAMK family protein kinase [Tritrichomonas foetus]|eukprot:OHS94570.1 CAMK family protein kinase [Tritrichomonas foetus]